jgi:hypothetical protein
MLLSAAAGGDACQCWKGLGPVHANGRCRAAQGASQRGKALRLCAGLGPPRASVHRLPAFRIA